MNDHVDPTIATWLQDGPDHGPREALARALETTRTVRQRPAWTFPGSWIPVLVDRRTGRAWGGRAGAIATLVLIAVLMVVVVVAVVGSRRPVPPPFGPAGNGLISVTIDGRLHLVDPVTGDRRAVPGSLGRDFTAAFSPDGTRIAYWTRRGADSLHLIVSDVGASTAVDVTDGASILRQEAVAPAWSPDGERIAFSGRDEGRLRLYVASADRPHVVAITDDTVHPTWPIWSPDGRWIAFRDDPEALADEPTGIAVVPVDGGPATVLQRSVAPFGQSFGIDFEAAQWSPDSTRIVYSRNKEDGLINVVAVVDLAGNETVLSDGTRDAVYPLWSPDGQRVAFGIADETIVVARPDGTDKRFLPTGVGLCELWRWSPDGTRIIGPGGEDCRFAVAVAVQPGVEPFVLDLPGEISGRFDWQRVAR